VKNVHDKFPSNRILWGNAAGCPPVAGVNNGPKRVLVLVPRTCPYVTFQGKGGFTDVVKSLEMGRPAWIIQVGPVSS